MRQISRLIIAGMLGLFPLPALGAGRGNGSAVASHAPTHSPNPPKTPSVGGAAPVPVPVAVHKTAAVTAAPGAPAAEVPDDDPVLDLVPVSNSAIGSVSQTTTFQPRISSYEEIEIQSSRISQNGALRDGADTSVTAPTSDSLWARINAASSQVQAVLNDQPEYRAAVARLAAAEQKLAALRAGSQRDSDQLRLAQQKALEARQEIVQMQMSALEADPNFSDALTRNEPVAVVGE